MSRSGRNTELTDDVGPHVLFDNNNNNNNNNNDNNSNKSINEYNMCVIMISINDNYYYNYE